MLPAKIRFVSMAAVLVVALCALSGDRSFNSFTQVDAQKVGKAEGKGAKLKQLQEERLATTVAFERMVMQRVKNNEGTLEELMEANRLTHEAALELCDSDKARMTVLEEYLAKTKTTEAIGLRAAKTGQGRESIVLRARAERLRVEIALERAKAGQGEAKMGDKAPVENKNASGKNASIQIGTVEAFESVRIFARVSGILKIQSVDIGDRVKRGQVLAVLDAPDLEMQLRMDEAAVDQARAQVMQAKTRIRGAEADVETAKATVKQADANVKSAASSVKFRALQLERMKGLFETKAIEQRLLDESNERHQAAVESEISAKDAVATANAHVAAALSKIEQAKAAVVVSEAGVKLAQANRDKSQELLAVTTIAAPFDGVITKRTYSPGELIRALSTQPIVTIQRTDRVRVVIAIPERDVLHIEPGNPVEVEIEALPGKKWSAKVSRTSHAEDPKTRTMRVEIDVANAENRLRPGMSAKVSILLEK
jgi:multidrug resistance efflux pump